MDIREVDYGGLKWFANNRMNVNGTAFVVLETPLRGDLSSSAIVIGSEWIRGWKNLHLFIYGQEERDFGFQSDPFHQWGFMLGAPRVREVYVVRAEDFTPKVRVYSDAPAARTTLAELCICDGFGLYDADGDRVELWDWKKNPSLATGMMFFKWKVPFGGSAPAAIVTWKEFGRQQKQKPTGRYYYERMGLSPRELLRVTPETVNQGTMLCGNVDYHDSPLGAALCIIDRNLSLKMAKKFLRWGANAANQHPNRNPYVGKMCPMEMAKWAHGQDAAYMDEIVPLLVAAGAEPSKEETPAAGDCAPDGK